MGHNNLSAAINNFCKLAETYISTQDPTELEHVIDSPEMGITADLIATDFDNLINELNTASKEEIVDIKKKKLLLDLALIISSCKENCLDLIREETGTVHTPPKEPKGYMLRSEELKPKPFPMEDF